MLLVEGMDLKYKNTALDTNLTVVSCSLNPSHWMVSHWTQQIWHPGFSCDHTFFFATAGMDTFSIYWKQIQNERATAPHSILVPLVTGKVFQIRVNTIMKDTIFFPILYTKNEDEYILLHTHYILIEIKYTWEEN